MAYPLYYVLIASISDPYEVYAGKTFLLPSKLTLEGSVRVFKEQSIATGYLNSIYYTILGTAVSVALIIVTGYCVSKKTLPFRRTIMLFYVFTMYFNGGLIPTYLVVSKLGMLNSVWALILPGGVAVFNVIVARTFFESSIPEELYEAASIDGSSNIGTFVKIALPLSKPILAVMVIFTMVAYWNDWQNGLYYLTDDRLFSVQVLLMDIQRNIDSLRRSASQGASVSLANLPSTGVRMAITVMGILPIMIIYPFVQKYFVKGIAIGAVKG